MKTKILTDFDICISVPLRRILRLLLTISFWILAKIFFMKGMLFPLMYFFVLYYGGEMKFVTHTHVNNYFV